MCVWGGGGGGAVVVSQPSLNFEGGFNPLIFRDFLKIDYICYYVLVIGHTFLNQLCYADDLCLISLSSAGMQKLLNLCSKYAVDHSLTYNAKKSFSLCFIPRTVKISRPQLYLNTLVIPHVSECKYLGIIVCQKNCDRDLKRQMKKICANANMLLRRFSKCSIPVKCYLFKTYCSNL